MESLFIEASKYTPEIQFDTASNLLKIRGESYPENVNKFYDPIFAWINEYLDEIDDQVVTLNVELYYFNSSSSKALMDLFDMLDEAAHDGKNIVVNWIYEEGDEDTLEFGEEFQEDIEKLKFNLVEKEE